MLLATKPMSERKRRRKPGWAERRERYLRERLPHWEEIEIRLRHRWTPYQVADWHAKAYPGERRLPIRTLYRYLKTKPPEWFVSRLTLQELVMPHMPRLLVLQEQAQLIELQKMRLQAFLQLERQAGDGGFGLPIPEVRANLELLDRMLERHLRTQQELGIEPKVTGSTGDGAREEDRNVHEELRQLVSRVVQLPPEQFGPTLVSLLGPPRVKQELPPGLVIEGEAETAGGEDGGEGRP